MPLVDIERGSELDKVHSQRMLHAFSQVVLRLFALEDPRVDFILRDYSIVLMPGPHAGIEYALGAKQIFADRLKALNAAAKKAEFDAKKPKSKKRR